MEKRCGTCGKCRNTHDGPYCYKGSSPKPVSTLRVMDCWVDPADVEPEPAATKVCAHCGRELPVSSFGRHSRTKDGYQPYCKECQSEMNKGHKKREPFQHNEAPKKPEPEQVEKLPEGMKRCSHCKKVLPVSEFNKHWKAKDGLQACCKECQTEMTAAARKKRETEGQPVKTRGPKSAHPAYVDEATGVTMRWCGHCKQYKPESEFSHDTSNKSGFATQCKACRVKHQKEVRERKRAKGQTKGETIAPKPAPIAAARAQEVDANGQTGADAIRDPLGDITIREFLQNLKDLGFQGAITFSF